MHNPWTEVPENPSMDAISFVSSPHPALNRFLLPNGEHVSCVYWNGLYQITGTDIGKSIRGVTHRDTATHSLLTTVRALAFRFEAFGRPVKTAMVKKFEEGVFSDLRNLKPGEDASLEKPKVSRQVNMKARDMKACTMSDGSQATRLSDRVIFSTCCSSTGVFELRRSRKCFTGEFVTCAGGLSWIDRYFAVTHSPAFAYFRFSVPHDRLFLDALERDLKREKEGQQPTTEVIGEPARSFRYVLPFVRFYWIQIEASTGGGIRPKACSSNSLLMNPVPPVLLHR